MVIKQKLMVAAKKATYRDCFGLACLNQLLTAGGANARLPGRLAAWQVACLMSTHLCEVCAKGFFILAFLFYLNFVLFSY